ncbi:hypothetical protein [Eoetvoesiella caeni]
MEYIVEPYCSSFFNKHRVIKPCLCGRNNYGHLGRNLASGRVFAGNFLFSTGPNTDMGGKRDTTGHIDMPMVECTVELDGKVVLEDGKFTDERLIVQPA